MKTIEFFKNLIDSLMSGSFERMKIISTMNQAFKEYYYSGELQRLCKVSITSGDPSYKHEMSAMFFRSGFKITIENDSYLAEREMRELSNYILSNTPFIRQLTALGFDTLYVNGRNNGMSIAYALKDYANLNNFLLK